MSMPMKYACTACGTETGNHEFGCRFEEHGRSEIERGYIDILSPLSDKRYPGLSKEELVEVVNDTQNGAWTPLHESVLDELVGTGRVEYRRGEYSLPDRQSRSKNLSQNSNEETIRSALFSIDPDLPHDKWVRLGFAVCNWDDGDRGRELFKEWSEKGEKWDSESEYKIDSIWKGHSIEGGATLSTLAYFAKKNGW